MKDLRKALEKTSLSEDQVQEIIDSVEAMVDDAAKDVESRKEEEFDEKLEHAYQSMTAENEKIKEDTERGYRQATEIIKDLQLRLETQEAEYEQKIDQHFEEAYQALKKERAEKEEVEEKVMQEANVKLNNMRRFITEKLDTFFQLQKGKIYREVRREVLSDPNVVEHQTTVHKIKDILADHLGFEEFAGTPNKKLDETREALESERNKVRVLEKRNLNLSRQNHSLNESIRESQKLITESREEKKREVRTDRNERKKMFGKEGGKGNSVLNEGNREYIVKENEESLNEGINKDLLTLAGVDYK